jgi:hypothetical protein
MDASLCNSSSPTRRVAKQCSWRMRLLISRPSRPAVRRPRLLHPVPVYRHCGAGDNHTRALADALPICWTPLRQLLQSSSCCALDICLAAAEECYQAICSGRLSSSVMLVVGHAASQICQGHGGLKLRSCSFAVQQGHQPLHCVITLNNLARAIRANSCNVAQHPCCASCKRLQLTSSFAVQHANKPLQGAITLRDSACKPWASNCNAVQQLR